MSETLESGEIEYVEKDKNKQALGGGLLGLGVALVGFNLDFIPDASSLGSMELAGIAIAIAGIIGVTVYTISG